MDLPTTGHSGRRRIAHRLALSALLTVSIAVATPASIVARDTDHPVTAAVVFVIVILVNGAIGGLAMGLLSALVSSILFNFFLRFPVYQFGFHTIDDFVPIIAFTLTAAISGALSGRLADRARVAEAARNQLEQLLWLSNDLQRAMTLGDIARALIRAVDGIDTARAMFAELHRDWPDGTETMPPASPLAPAGRDRRRRSSAALDPSAALALLRIALDRRDLMDRQARAEAELEAEQFKTALLSCVSHDLRTPLAVISASASGLSRYRDSLDPATQSEMLTTIEEQCDRLKDFVERMLQLSRLEAGLSRSDLQPVDVEEAVQKAVRRVRQGHVGRVIDYAADESDMFSSGHPDLLAQAFLNIVENAVQYSGTDSIVTVRLIRQGDRLRLCVEDQGSGIAPDDLPRVFERFWRGGNAAGRQGMGLGLSFSRDFLLFMGGTLHIESPAAGGRGTLVEIFLPAIADLPAETFDACEYSAD